MSSLNVIKHPEFGEIRTEIINNEVWFCGIDVCNVLGYENARVTLKKHCREGGVSKRYAPTSSGEQEMNFINEGNLYRLILKSQMPNAERFESWVL
jgi:prophage antirepressor-like protein